MSNTVQTDGLIEAITLLHDDLGILPNVSFIRDKILVDYILPSSWGMSLTFEIKYPGDDCSHFRVYSRRPSSMGPVFVLSSALGVDESGVIAFMREEYESVGII